MGSFHNGLSSKKSLLYFLSKAALLSLFVQSSNAEIIEYNDIAVVSTHQRTSGSGCEVPPTARTTISNLTVDTVTRRVSYHTTADGGEDISYTANRVSQNSRNGWIIFKYKEISSSSYDEGRKIYHDNIYIDFVSNRKPAFKSTEIFTTTTISESGTTVCVDRFGVVGNFGGEPESTRTEPASLFGTAKNLLKENFCRDGCKSTTKLVSIGVRG